VHSFRLFIWDKLLLKIDYRYREAWGRGESVDEVPHTRLQEGGFDGGQMQQQVKPCVCHTVGGVPQRNAIECTKQALMLEGIQKRRRVREGLQNGHQLGDLGVVAALDAETQGRDELPQNLDKPEYAGTAENSVSWRGKAACAHRDHCSARSSATASD
jgi:hypothetical protein